MKYEIKIFLGVLFAAALHLHAQQSPVLKKLEFRGLKALDPKDAAAVMGLGMNDTLPGGWPGPQCDSLGRWAGRRGYFSFRVDSIMTEPSPDGRSANVTLWANEGEPARIGEWTVEGLDPEWERKLFPIMASRTGNVFDESVLEKDIERILDALENGGRPLASVQVASLSMDAKSRLRIGLFADPGPMVRLKSIGVRGNTVTRKRVILREARLQPGAVFSRKEVESARDALSRLGFFEEVFDPEIRFAEDGAEVVLPVKDGGTNTFDAVAGYNPPQSDRENGTVTGRLEFGFRNLMGTGRLLDVYWEKKNANSQAMRFGYEEPWLLGRPIHPGLRFLQEIRDTLYVEREWRLSVRFTPLARYGVSAALETGRREIVIDSLGSALLGLAQTRAWFFSAQLDYNTLDEPLNPRQGVRYHTEFSTGKKRNIGPDFLVAGRGLASSVFTRTVRAGMEAALPVSGRQVFYLGAHGAEIRSGDPAVPLSDQVRFGGSGTVRGYQEDAFRGSLVAWFNAEYRRLLSRYSRAFVFVDGGIAQRREPEAGLVRTDMIGYGFGIRLETRLGIVGVDFGLGEGDTFLKGKVHVRLVNRF